MPKILIVDDDVSITELMKALVKMDGHQPTTVNDSTKAIEVELSDIEELQKSNFFTDLWKGKEEKK